MILGKLLKILMVGKNEISLYYIYYSFLPTFYTLKNPLNLNLSSFEIEKKLL